MLYLIEKYYYYELRKQNQRRNRNVRRCNIFRRLEARKELTFLFEEIESSFPMDEYDDEDLD